jgi:V/A-type H+-transporting ATPase subunit I
VIVSMEKVRILGPRDRLPSVMATLQDYGVVHLSTPAQEPPFVSLHLSARQVRHVAQVEAALDDIEEAVSRLAFDSPANTIVQTPVEGLAREVWLARRARRTVVALSAEQRALEDEHDRLGRVRSVVQALVRMGVPGRDRVTRTFFLVLSHGVDQAEERLERALSETIGECFTLEIEPLEGGELAVALIVPAAEAARVEALLPEAGVEELELPEIFGSGDFEAGLRALDRRLDELDDELSRFESRRKRLGEWLQPGLMRARSMLNDWLTASSALCMAAASPHLFVLEGWLPASDHAALGALLAEREGDRIVVEAVAKEDWSARDVPVAIRNPRIFRPFEVITGWLPLPRYGTIDPTPFVAVFFPMFFGLILGDMGYGTILGVLAAIGWLRSARGGLLRPISEIAAACAVFSVSFGVIFGELFGDLGHRLFGLQSLAFSREEAFVPFLALAVALGFVHVILGLILGALSSLRSNPRESIGRGLAAVMLVLTGAMLLVAINVLPDRFFTPVVVALLITFPLLIIVEGVMGAVELLSRMTSILSYARIMALGTASVMLAVAANQMVGAMGGAVVGVVFATLFHLVNFGLGVFSPTIHALRLHFVEFFGTFYSPGGQVYRPFRHWRPADVSTPQSA